MFDRYAILSVADQKQAVRKVEAYEAQEANSHPLATSDPEVTKSKGKRVNANVQ